MRTITTIRDMQRFADAERTAGRRIALVPTMGALHEGHLELVRQARSLADTVVASIFVNPIQFNSKQDFELYPRDDARDAALLAAEGTDVLFLPSAGEMYPEGFETRIEVTETSRPLCGEQRPGHFGGVATVVTKLLLAAKPHVAVFGEKDWQQLQVVRRLVRDLNLDVAIEPAAIVREEDGLAMSSRNRRLGAAERDLARRIPAGIEEVRNALGSGEREAAALEARFRRAVNGIEGVRVEYAEVRDPESLARLERVGARALFAVAVWVGDVRLIDNTILEGEASR